ncbi:hypothetical protein HKX48_005489 [Thoreauomyces humboldtii]|nr:hypothetical protein HKX48_005489 [Thoreauomyces humboldtii]
MIVLQIGQCGIQIGQQFFSILEAENQSNEKLDRSLSGFRQTIIDTERKTWRKHQASTRKSKFPTRYIDNGSSGRGNNWAHGYWDVSHLESILSTVRKQTEAADNHDGFMMLHSIAGGTGSGLGSRVAEELRDQYPKNYLTTFAVTPFSTGDTALQHYNSLLSLGWMQKYSDMIGIFSNDAVMGTVTRQYGLMSSGGGIPKVTLDNMNEYIAHCIAGLFLPVTEIQSIGGELKYKPKPSACDVWNLIAELTPVPGCKLTSSSSSTLIPDVRVTKKPLSAPVADWDDLRTALTRNMPVLPSGVKRKCVAARVQARGVLGGDYWKRIGHFETQLINRLGLIHGADWLDVRVSSLYATSVKSTTRSLDLCYNGSDAAYLLDSITTKARAMYDAKAYLHWYERYGGTEVEEVFGECFETLADATTTYREFLHMED